MRLAPEYHKKRPAPAYVKKVNKRMMSAAEKDWLPLLQPRQTKEWRPSQEDIGGGVRLAATYIKKVKKRDDISHGVRLAVTFVLKR